MEIKALDFQVTEKNDQVLYTAYTPEGRFTVLDRMTGFGVHQTESGYLDSEYFYLLPGDIRFSGWTVPEAIERFKSSGYIAPKA